MSGVLEKENGQIDIKKNNSHNSEENNINNEEEEGKGKKELKVTAQSLETLCEEMRIREQGPNDNNGSEFGLVGVIRYKKGGLQIVDKEQMKTQSGVLKELLTTFGANLLKGKSVVNISLPVRIFEPRSFLERIPDAWAYGPIYLSRAATCLDPLERLKWTMTFVLAGLHRGTTQRKPFNPILGETYQASYSDGTQLYLEQVSHHPPISAFQMFGPGEIYQLWGYHDFRASFRPNSIVGGQVGPNHVDFLDGARITYHMPSVCLSGTLWGERIFQWTGKLPFEDKKNGLKAEIVFNPDKKGGIVAYIPFSWSSSPSSPTDTIRGEITLTTNPKEAPKVVSRFEGSWIDGISFDGKPYWTKQQFKPFVCRGESPANALPSDCQFRSDLIALKSKNEELSQTLKTKMEEAQRYDNKLRKQHAHQSHRFSVTNKTKTSLESDSVDLNASDSNDVYEEELTALTETDD